MFLLEFITGDYWRVISCGEIVYANGPNQKTLDGYNVTDSPEYNKIKDLSYPDFIWNDNLKHMYLMTEDIKTEMYKSEKLKLISDMIDTQKTFLDKNALSSLVQKIKQADSKTKVDETWQQDFEQKRSQFKIDIGL